MSAKLLFNPPQSMARSFALSWMQYKAPTATTEPFVFCNDDETDFVPKGKYIVVRITVRDIEPEERQDRHEANNNET